MIVMQSLSLVKSEGGLAHVMTERPILIVEDDPDVAALLGARFRELRHPIVTATDLRSAVAIAATERPALIVLDVMLPDGSGFDVCRQLRAREDYTPILMLTGRSSERDKIAGLEAGADDYVTKPFSFDELLSRIRALLRRAEGWRNPEAATPLMMTGEIAIDVQKRRVHLRGKLVEVTAKEFDLLLLLARSPGRVFSRRELLKLVWGYEHDGYRHTIDTHVSRLRSKIAGSPGDPAMIETVWGVGYRFREGRMET